MNAVFAAVLLAVVATCSGTGIYSTYGSQYYYPSQYTTGYQYVQPSVGYQYVQPVVSSSSVVSSPVAYTSQAAVVPAVNTLGYGYNYGYPYAYSSYGLLKK